MFDPLQMPLSGVHSISASAGTGKTYTITTLYLRFLLEGGCSTDQVLVTTFTEAATAELRDRLRGRINEAFDVLHRCRTEADLQAALAAKQVDAQVAGVLRQAGAWRDSEARTDELPDSLARIIERLEDAKLSFDQAPVFTIHGFCSRILQELVFETGTRFNVDLVSSLDEWIAEAVDDFVARIWSVPGSVMERWLPLNYSLYQQLQMVAGKAMDNPSLEVVPDDGDLDDLFSGDLIQRADRLFDALTRSWHSEREHVHELIDTAIAGGVLNKRSYGRPDLIDRSFAFVDELVDAQSLALFKWNKDKLDGDQSRLTRKRLEASTLKAQLGNTPQHAVFDHLQDLAELSEEFASQQKEIRSRALARAARFVREHVSKRRGERGIMSFGDLLHRVDEALSGRQRDLLISALREKYRVALVDEFQDTDPVQYRIFSQVFRDIAGPGSGHDPVPGRQPAADGDAAADLVQADHQDPAAGQDPTAGQDPAAGQERASGQDLTGGGEPASGDAPLFDSEHGRAFVMIGDPKQSIYRFRGADLAAYLEAEEQTPAQNRHEMGTNWRSDRSLVQSVQAVFDSVTNPFLNARIPLPPVGARHDDRLEPGPAFSITLVPRSAPPDDAGKLMNAPLAANRCVERVVDDIITQLHSGERIQTSSGQWRELEPSDIAVLCGAGRHLRQIQDALAARGLPSVLRVDDSVFSTFEAESLRHVLRAVEGPAGLSRILKALQTPVFGLNAEKLDSLHEKTESLSGFVERFQEWHDCWQRDGFIVMWRRLLDDQQTIPRLAGHITGERQITNYLHLGELLHRHSVEAHAGPDELLRWFEQRIVRKDGNEDEAMLRLETDSAAIQLCTIHRSKGLEYPVVYCPTLWSVREWKEPAAVLSRTGPDGSELDMPQIDVGSELIDQRYEDDRRESGSEDRRLLYVALTRARHQCHVYWAASKNSLEASLGQIMFGELSGQETDSDLDRKLREWVKLLNTKVDPDVADRIDLHSAGSRRPATEKLRYQLPRRTVSELNARPIQRDHLPVRTQTSFTGLAASASGRVTDEIADRDSIAVGAAAGGAVAHDEFAAEELAAGVSAVGEPGTSLASSAEFLTGRDESEESEAVPLATMPGGRLVGDLVHAVLEQAVIDPRIAPWNTDPGPAGTTSRDSSEAAPAGSSAAPSRDEVLDVITERLHPVMDRMQLDPRWLEPLAETLTTCLVEPLPLRESSGLRESSELRRESSDSIGSSGSRESVDIQPARLSGIGREHLAPEIPFLLRIGGEHEFTAEKLARVFESSSNPVLQQYGPRARSLSPGRLKGFLAGFIDLVFQWNGRWYVADYKTNFLGPDFSDYSPGRLDRTMVDHDYVLQASLYSVAICGLLRQRIPGFDIDRDFGGAAYLFVRGFPLKGAIRHGVWSCQFDAAFIDQLTAALDGRS